MASRPDPTMWLGSKLPMSPLYDPHSKFKRFLHEEDYDYIKLVALREEKLYEDSSPLPDLGDEVEWLRPKEIVNRPYFIKGTPSRFDALLGDLKRNSWFVIAMEALTFNDKLMQFVVPAGQSFDTDYSGAFHFRFWQLGTWYDVVVDDRLPVYKYKKGLCYAHSKKGNVFWAALLEKAFCKMYGINSFDDASPNVGAGTTAFQDLTGGIVENINTSKPPAGRPLEWFLKQLIIKGSFAGCSISADQRPEYTTGLRAKHSYLISGGYYFDNKNSPNYGQSIVRIMNPWGEVEWTGAFSDEDQNNWLTVDRIIRQQMEYTIEDDGEFWMKETDFVKYFPFMHICHLGPSQYLFIHTETKITNWITKTFRGEWVKDVSAGGPVQENRHINPQFKFLVEKPGSAPPSSYVTFVVEVTQRLPFIKGSTSTCLGFHVYSLESVRDKQAHLDSNFFKKIQPLNEIDFQRSEGCTHVDSFRLSPGWYCIVPCTSVEGVETSFLLRIFTESDLDKWEYDSRISKSLPVAEEPNGEVKYRELKHIFDEAAQHEEVDWIGIKNIFKRSSNDLVRSLLTQPSKGQGNEHIEFSKDECRSLIAMLDHDNSGKLNYNEFCSLWKKLLFWRKTYDSFRESEGYMKVDKLRDALSSIGFNLNKQVIHKLVHFYANDRGQIFLTDFILCGIILETFFSRNINSKTQEKRGLSFTLEEWVRNIMAI